MKNINLHTFPTFPTFPTFFKREKCDAELSYEETKHTKK